MDAGYEDGPLHAWHELDEAGLRSFAAQYVGFATNEMSDPGDLAWTFEEFDLEEFLALPTDWHAYRQDEVDGNPRYADGFADQDFHTPVVLSVEAGEPIIWDGWHRIACCIVRGDRAIMAIVGREPA